MELSVRVLCRPHLARGFELAGLQATRASDAVAAAVALRRLASDAEVGVVLVDDGLYAQLSSELKGRLDRQALPIIAPVPSPSWDEKGEAEAYVLEILRQAIGYRVRPR
ncbi:MAG: V-type ATP synthase subunit F [Myxococcota bacterium]